MVDRRDHPCGGEKPLDGALVAGRLAPQRLDHVFFVVPAREVDDCERALADLSGYAKRPELFSWRDFLGAEQALDEAEAQAELVGGLLVRLDVAMRRAEIKGIERGSEIALEALKDAGK